MTLSSKWGRFSSSIPSLLLSLSVLLIVPLSIVADAQATATGTSKTFKIYHSLGQSKPFIPRGTITISTSNNEGTITTIENDQSCLGPNALKDMDDLVSEDGFYRIKVVDEVGSSFDSGSEKSVLASVPGCEVRRANFREEIELSLSQTGALLSISYTPLVSPLAAQCQELDPLSSNDREYEFQTLISYSTSTPGMSLPKILPKMRPPPGLSVIKQKKSTQPSSSTNNNNNNNNNNQQRGFQSDEEDEKKKQQENQSFLRKYWYIILPSVLMLLLSGEEPPPPQQQQQQRPRGAGTAPAVGNAPMSTNASVASSGSGAGTTRQRRGKRG